MPKHKWYPWINALMAVALSTGLAQADVPTTTQVAVQVLDSTVTAAWSPVADAYGYRLYYAPYPSASPIASIDMGTDTTISVPAIPGLSYYIAVTAYNADGESTLSNIDRFETSGQHSIPSWVAEQAAAEGLVWAMVELNVPPTLTPHTEETTAMEQALFAYLDLPADHATGRFLPNGTGQVSILLTPDGLARLANAGSLIRAIFEDTTESMRCVVSDLDGRLAAMKDEILRNGQANVRVYHFLAAPEDVLIDLEQFYLLKEAADVRTMHLVGWNPAGTFVDPSALAAARETGYADVLVSLYPPLDYTPMMGEITSVQWNAQARRLHEMFEVVLAGLQFEEYFGFPEAHVPRFPLALLENPPAGLASIEANMALTIAAE